MVWITLDHFGLIVLCNAITALLFLPIVTFPLGLAGSLCVCHKLVSTQQASVHDFWAGIRRCGARVYGWGLGTLSFVAISLLALRFYCLQMIKAPVWGAMGSTVALVFLTIGMLSGALLLPRLIDTDFKEAMLETFRWMVSQPLSTLSFFTAMLAIEILLAATGLGFLLFGLVWPILGAILYWKEYRHIHHGEPAYQEDRDLKDFFIPSNLLK